MRNCAGVLWHKSDVEMKGGNDDILLDTYNHGHCIIMGVTVVTPY